MREHEGYIQGERWAVEGPREGNVRDVRVAALVSQSTTATARIKLKIPGHGWDETITSGVRSLTRIVDPMPSLHTPTLAQVIIIILRTIAESPICSLAVVPLAPLQTLTSRVPEVVC